MRAFSHDTREEKIMKKRTAIPFYGKANQRLEKLASDRLKAGDAEGAEFYLEKSRVVYNKRREDRRAHR